MKEDEEEYLNEGKGCAVWSFVCVVAYNIYISK
jgi:hypothetical protein